MGCESEVANRPDGGFADAADGAAMRGAQLVIFGIFGAAEQGPEAESGRAFKGKGVVAVAIAPGEGRRPPAVRPETPRVDRAGRPAGGALAGRELLGVDQMRPARLQREIG